MLRVFETAFRRKQALSKQRSADALTADYSALFLQRHGGIQQHRVVGGQYINSQPSTTITPQQNQQHSMAGASCV